MSAKTTNRARVGDALDLLFRVLRPYVEREMRAVYQDRWLREARDALHGKPPSRWDTSDLLTLIYFKFFHVFSGLGHEGRSWVSLLKEVRKKWAHQGRLSLDDTRRALETTILLLRAVGAQEEADRLEPQMVELMRRELQQKLDEPLPETADPVGREDTPAPAETGPGLLGKGLRKVRNLLQKTPVEPLELRRDLLDAVERAAEPHRKHFTFSRLVVHILAEDDQTRLLFETALAAPGEPFRDAVQRRLADARIPAREGLRISWKIHRTRPQRLARQFADRAVYVELNRRKVYTQATLTVLKGKARRDKYVIKSGTTITIGRSAEVVDEKGRLVRRNTIAFEDYTDRQPGDAQKKVQETVSRVHARIRYDDADAVFRLYDDQSTCGTSVVRADYLVPIPVRQQPVALQDGDLLYFGEACVRFETGRRR